MEMKVPRSFTLLLVTFFASALAFDGRRDGDVDVDKRLPDLGPGRGKYQMVHYKRLPLYDFGLGKRSEAYYGDDGGLDVYPPYADRGGDDDDDGGDGGDVRDADAFSPGDKRPVPLYDFGLGKRAGAYEFGLGKRAGAYEFGLGKRAGPYDFGLGKRNQRFNFGLGKRTGPYSFGLGKRIDDGNRFAFGLGKRGGGDGGGGDDDAARYVVKRDASRDVAKRASNVPVRDLRKYSNGDEDNFRGRYDFGLGKRNY